ncbi:hypothetical protein HRI_002269100 [Hibiscus trionum]|uniref:Uncharacterized protein n=1 Tax=Hibiscus trionum TaxID=183268 RepID=A0A9W7M339_HIBTR|nr:hypothetical protein HRI_002269100 [Hibiscus trionum]
MSSLPLIPLLPFTKSKPVIKHANKIVTIKYDQVPGKKAYTNQIRSFSNKSQGVICYTDENGETVCEGYDKGTRCPRQIPGTLYHLSDVEILDLLQDRWLQTVSGGGFSSANKGVSIVQDDS